MVGVDPIYVLVVNGADVTTKMYENSASMSYTDTDGAEADTLDIKIDGYWDIVQFDDRAELWLGYASNNVWHVGTFTVQSVSVSAFETTIKATSADFNNSLKEKQNKTHKNKTIKKIVEEIATKRGLKARCDIDSSIEYIHQNNESDIHFLTRIAKDSNAIFKIKKDELVFINRDNTNTHTIDIAETFGNGPELTFNNRTIYGSGKAQYWDTQNNKWVKVSVGSGKPIIKIDDYFESESEARRVIESKLKNANRAKVSGRLSIYGMDIVAGNKLKLVGDKRFDDMEFTIKRVTHSINGSGFVTALEFESN